ncbi:MAG: DUF2089 domain-containing protein [Chloroflexi bacterium]|nr:DUF2089 domain-containing protein [Chloroflexota bacterium]
MTNRQEILNLLANGKITADEAADMLNALKTKAPVPPVDPEPPADLEMSPDLEPPAEPVAVKAEPKPAASGKKPAWFRVRVRDLESGANKVSVNIPLRMLNFGLKVGRRFSPELEGLDYGELTGLMNDMGAGMLVEVEDEESNEHVQVFVD